MTHKPTPEQRAKVQELSAIGTPQEDIAHAIGISPQTLRRHYPDELRMGGIAANLAVANRLFQTATDPDKPNVVAMIFWLKCRAGWRDHDKPEGAKEAVAEAARRIATGGGRFSPSQAPRLVVNNATKGAEPDDD